MRKLFLTMLLISAMVLSSVGMASAESILFPYIANNTGNVETIVSVINANSGNAVADTGVTRLHYRYLAKAVETGALQNTACAEQDFTRPTTQFDIVTFAVGTSTQTGSGYALFETPTQPAYNAGAGAVNAGGPFNHSLGSPRVGYLMVTTANLTTGDVDVANRFNLDGEAALYDLVNGAMWGYRALISNAGAAAGAAATLSSYIFTDHTGTGAENGRDVLVENGVAVASAPKVAIYPPNQFQTRFFVTPLVRVTGAASALGDLDMRLAAGNTQPRTRIRLLDASGNPGYYDRNENPASAGQAVQVKCVGRVDLTDMAGTAWFGVGNPLYTQGGWAYVDLQAPTLIDATHPGGSNAVSYNAWVAKLEFGNLTGLSGMINSANIIRDQLGAVAGITGGR